MKLALWGYGNHGRDMELILTECWADRYQITAVFDQRFAEQGPSDILGLPVSDPDTAAAMYRDGVYEGMLITVFSVRPISAAIRVVSSRTVSSIRIEVVDMIIPPYAISIAYAACGCNTIGITNIA